MPTQNHQTPRREEVKDINTERLGIDDVVGVAGCRCYIQVQRACNWKDKPRMGHRTQMRPASGRIRREDQLQVQYRQEPQEQDEHLVEYWLLCRDKREDD